MKTAAAAAAAPKEPTGVPNPDENVWVIDRIDDEDDGGDLDKETAFELTGGEWEPMSVRVKRRFAAFTKRFNK
jgi:hypothetical protein